MSDEQRPPNDWYECAARTAWLARQPAPSETQSIAEDAAEIAGTIPPEEWDKATKSELREALATAKKLAIRIYDYQLAATLRDLIAARKKPETEA